VNLNTAIPGVLYAKSPNGAAAPLVFDSPHSGSDYPPDFDFVAPRDVVRKAEDSFVDELFRDAPDYGGYFQAALFPRSYIDPNRSLLDIDARLLEELWPGDVSPSEKTRYGHGLIWRLCPPHHNMYDRKLGLEEVRRRIEIYWRPYHDLLRDTLSAVNRDFGQVWHLNCHSMPGTSTPRDSVNKGAVDIVLGDRDGTTCDPAFTQMVAETLRAMGYSVCINDPYKGVELVRAYSDPTAGRHSLQIEINRSIYMNESTCERNGGFDELRANMGALMAAMRDFATSKVAAKVAAKAV
jgi:N-formylglutamate deformylase